MYADGLFKLSKASPWILAGLTRSCHLLTAPLQIIATSLWRFYYPLDALDLKLPSELQRTPSSYPPHTLPNLLCCLFLSYLIYSVCLYCSQSLPSSISEFPISSSSHSFSPSHLALLQLNKQTNPLPLDTQLRRGDLLCLSGRILSDIVAPVNKRKAPEARGAALFVRWADYLPHTPFCLFSLSGV